MEDSSAELFNDVMGSIHTLVQTPEFISDDYHHLMSPHFVPILSPDENAIPSSSLATDITSHSSSSSSMEQDHQPYLTIPSDSGNPGQWASEQSMLAILFGEANFKDSGMPDNFSVTSDDYIHCANTHENDNETENCDSFRIDLCSDNSSL